MLEGCISLWCHYIIGSIAFARLALFKGNKMQITVYDGADTIGGNKILLEDNGVNLFFDFGINFHLRNQFLGNI